MISCLIDALCHPFVTYQMMRDPDRYHAKMMAAHERRTARRQLERERRREEEMRYVEQTAPVVALNYLYERGWEGTHG